MSTNNTNSITGKRKDREDDNNQNKKQRINTEDIHTICDFKKMFEEECLICFSKILDDTKGKYSTEYLEKVFFRACKLNKMEFMKKIFSIEDSLEKVKLLNSARNAKRALHYCIENNNIEMIILFFRQNNIDIFTTPKDGKSVFSYAASKIIEDTKLPSETLAEFIDNDNGKFDLEKCNYLELISKQIEKGKEKIIPFKLILSKLDAILKDIFKDKEYLNQNNIVNKYFLNIIGKFSKAMNEAINAQNYCVLHMMLTIHNCFEKIYPFIKFENPAFTAASKGDVNIIKMLADHKVNFAITDKSNTMPIHFLCNNGFLSSLKFVIDNYYLKNFEHHHKDNIVVESTKNLEYVFRCETSKQMSVLHCAALCNKPNTLMYLLNLNGAYKYINIRNNNGSTPVILCCSRGNNDCLKILLKFSNIDILIGDKNNNTPIVYAIKFNSYECIKELLEYISQKITSLRCGPKNIDTQNLINNLIFEKKKWLSLTYFDEDKKNLINFKDEPNHLKTVFNNIQTIKDVISLDRYPEENEPKKILPTMEVIINNLKGTRGVLRKCMFDYARVLHSSFIFKKIFDFKSNKVGITNDDHSDLHSLYLPYFDVLENNTCQRMENVGRFMALALVHNPVYLPLSTVFFKTLFDEIITLEDILPQDQIDFLRNMEHLSDKEILDLGLYFKETSMLRDGTVGIFDLIPGGSNIQVNKENLDIYLKSKLEFYTVKGNRDLLLKAFKDGFYSIIPKVCLKYFDTHTLIPLIVKKQDIIPINEWKLYCKTTISEPCHESSSNIEWFWNYVRSTSYEKHLKLIEFIYGTPILPLGDLKTLLDDNIPFIIEFKKTSHDVLPWTFTNKYTLNLPNFSSEEKLIEMFDIALANIEGFQSI